MLGVYPELRNFEPPFSNQMWITGKMAGEIMWVVLSGYADSIDWNTKQKMRRNTGLSGMEHTVEKNVL